MGHLRDLERADPGASQGFLVLCQASWWAKHHDVQSGPGPPEVYDPPDGIQRGGCFGDPSP